MNLHYRKIRSCPAGIANPPVKITMVAFPGSPQQRYTNEVGGISEKPVQRKNGPNAQVLNASKNEGQQDG